jgi:thiol:disulfide interchange protein DsbD
MTRRRGFTLADAVLRVVAWLMLTLWLAMAGPARGADDFLPPEQAFRFSAVMAGADAVEVRFEIAPGYYMYRERFAFASKHAGVGSAVLPPGQVHYEEVFQKDMETYRNSVSIRVPVQASGKFTLEVTSQGCSDGGLCYPPQRAQVTLTPPASSSQSGSSDAGAEAGHIERALHSGSLLTILPLFLLLGLGLSFTPCMLPMLPILSSIIVGQKGEQGRLHGFTLSLSYSFGMAVVYTLMGVAAGLAGRGLAAALQNAWVLGAFSMLMVALALAMFGLYELQMPASIQSRLTSASNRHGVGGYAGVFTMGALSSLIVGPCVAAPLAGALVYISQTKDAFIGGSALFAMAAGMSVPLLLIGTSAGALVPRAGPWMAEIRRFFGVLMLGTALWIVSPVIPPRFQMLGWALLGVGYAIALFAQRPRHLLTTATALLAAVLGGTQMVGLAMGGADPLAPFTAVDLAEPTSSHFERIASVQELDAALASSEGKTVMLDFYADWCVSCKEMERFTFSDERVRARLGAMRLLQVDVTANSAADQALLARFGLFGPPGIVFFGPGGKEVPRTRVIGYQKADKFLESLAAVETGTARLISTSRQHQEQ